MFFFFSSRRRHTRLQGDWSSDVCSSDLAPLGLVGGLARVPGHDELAVGLETSRAVELDRGCVVGSCPDVGEGDAALRKERSEEHTSELQSPCNLVCRLLLDNNKHLRTSL